MACAQRQGRRDGPSGQVGQQQRGPPSQLAQGQNGPNGQPHQLGQQGQDGLKQRFRRYQMDIYGNQVPYGCRLSASGGVDWSSCGSHDDSGGDTGGEAQHPSEGDV